MDERIKFYERCVDEMLISKNASILVCGGGILDKNVFHSLGYKNVIISNIDGRINENEYEPYQWKYADAENLPFDNDAFDYTVIYAAIHHTHSPHRVLTEMYRVSRNGLLVLESRDSFVMHLMEKFAIAETYECTAVYTNNCQHGGVNNTEIPNYIYRWTEREIEKTIQSYAPYYQHEYVYKYGAAFSKIVELERNAWFKKVFMNMAKPLYRVFTKIFPKQGNQFACYVGKSDKREKLFPWLKMENGEIKFNKDWGNKKYKN